jgi:regulator of ribonuclease activity A
MIILLRSLRSAHQTRIFQAKSHASILSSTHKYCVLMSTFRSTPDLCDDFEDTIRVVDPSLGLKNLGGKTHFGGQVVTVKCHEDNSLVKQMAKTDGTGKVMVVDGGGSRRRALLGDQVAMDCITSGWEGLVIYGSIRDVDEIGQLPLGVQALGTHPCKTIKRNEGQTNIPVTVGGVTFAPAIDCVVCDNNGIVVNATDMANAKED